MFEEPVAPLNSSSEDLLDARKKFEAEKLTRRSALRKFGITSGMAVFGMFAADDLARLVIGKMEEHKATRQIAETVAHEFKNSGIAFADSSSSGPCDYCNGDCTCLCGCNKEQAIAAACAAFPGCCDKSNVPKGTCVGGFSIRISKAETTADNCVAGCPP